MIFLLGGDAAPIVDASYGRRRGMPTPVRQ